MLRVLVVEDSPTQVHQLAFLLEEADFAVDIAPDAERGYELLPGWMKARSSERTLTPESNRP